MIKEDKSTFFAPVQESTILLTTLNAKYIHLNLAIRLLYSLNKQDERLSFKEFTIKEDKQFIAQHCSEFEVVCFSCYIWNITQTLEVCELIKTINPNTKILLGGPEVSYDWQEVLQLNCVDYIVVGEGEIPFAMFLQKFPEIDFIPNLAYKKNGEIEFHHKAENFDVNLYENINPYIYDEPESLANRVLYIETSRGCPYKCEFCLASLDNRVRYLPIQNIKSNLLYLMQHGKVIKFLDRTFNVKKDFTLDVFQFILDNARPVNVFQFEITADILHPAIIEFIQQKVPKGMFRFEIGIQTVNQKANLEVSRKQNFDKTKGVIYAIKDYVDLHLDLIVGLPLDYWADMKYSIEEVFKLYPPELQLGFLKFLKGTPVREKYEQHGFEFDKKAPYQIIKSNYLSEDELNRILNLENALEIYWNKPRLTNTLMYITQHYSIFECLLQLGTYFKTKFENKAYGLTDLYTTAYDFFINEYEGDENLVQLFTIDYYLQYKVKPTTRFKEEINRKEKFQWLDALKLPHQQLRYVVLKIDFDYNLFLRTQQIKNSQEYAIIEYSGTAKPKLIIHKLQTQLG